MRKSLFFVKTTYNANLFYNNSYLSPFIQQKMSWTNKSNDAFYNELFKRELAGEKEGSIGDFIKKSGMSSCPDLKVMTPDFPKNLGNKKVLDIGTGSGRIIPTLLNHGLNITAVERNPYACAILKSKFGDKITLINDSIKDTSLNETFIMIFWIWCGVCDFPKKEQHLLINNLLNLLQPLGVLFIDIPNPNETNATHKAMGEQKIHVGSTIYTGYVPTHEEMTGYLKKRWDCVMKKTPYKTDTDRLRNIYTIFKQDKSPNLSLQKTNHHLPKLT